MIYLQTVTLSVVTIYIIAQMAFLLWLWVGYDIPLNNLRKRLRNKQKEIQEGARGRGITKAGLQPHLNAAERPIKEEIDELEYKRRLFLDRINLFSILKIK